MVWKFTLSLWEYKSWMVEVWMTVNGRGSRIDSRQLKAEDGCLPWRRAPGRTLGICTPAFAIADNTVFTFSHIQTIVRKYSYRNNRFWDLSGSIHFLVGTNPKEIVDRRPSMSDEFYKIWALGSSYDSLYNPFARNFLFTSYFESEIDKEFYVYRRTSLQERWGHLLNVVMSMSPWMGFGFDHLH